MAALGELCFEHVFAHWVPAEDAQRCIAGLILLGVSLCMALVFVWSPLTDGDAKSHQLARARLGRRGGRRPQDQVWR